jgi:putative acetyltransferase
MTMDVEVREDDLKSEQTQDLLRLHLNGMHENTPAEHVFALDISGLQAPGITVWSAWCDGKIAGIGALKELGNGAAEVKSMRTHPDHLRKGVGAAVLERIVQEARRRGITRLSLETGRGPAFDAAVALYRRRGFVSGGAFGDYTASEFNQFMHMDF